MLKENTEQGQLKEKNIDTAKDKKCGKHASYNFLLISRWLFIILAIILYNVDPAGSVSTAAIFETVSVVLVYQILSSLYIIRNHNIGKKTVSIFIYIDITVLCIFSAINGGTESDIYIMLLFLIGYCGFSGQYDTAVMTFFTIFVYSISAFLASSNGPAGFNYCLLLIRDGFIMLAGFGISRINVEFKKYDSMHRKEFLLARTDKLTGLANRHYFDQKLVEEVEYADASGCPINVLIFDLDNFKLFNDTYGHIWGDKLLTLFADIIRQSIRKTDIPVRYGGEEFLILIRDLDVVLAKSVGERIRKQLEKQRIYVGDQERKKMTVSCGLAQYPIHSANIKTVIELADKALYKAKETGKNKVVGYDEMDSSQ